MNQIKLNAEEVKNLLRHIISNNKKLQEEGKKPISVNLEGPAGIGKTSALLELSAELDMECIKLNLAEMEEVGELTGFPVKEYEVVKDNVSKWIPENMIPMYVKGGYKPTSSHRMNYAVPEWIAGKTKPGILILDDFSRANQMFMQAIMEICDRQEYISWKLPAGWTVVLSSNPDDGNYNVTTLDIAQTTRFINLEMKFDMDVWARWAEKDALDSRAINFMLMNPEVITERYNARSFVTFFNSISSIKNFEDNLDLLQMLGEGSIGAEASTLFTAFIHNKLDKIVRPKDLILHDNETYIIGELNSCVTVNGEYRADISSVLATRVVNFCLSYAESNPINQAIINRLIRLTTDCDAFTDDLKYYIVKEILAGNKTKFSKIMLDKKVMDMSLK